MARLKVKPIVKSSVEAIIEVSFGNKISIRDTTALMSPRKVICLDVGEHHILIDDIDQLQDIHMAIDKYITEFYNIRSKKE